MFARNWRPGIGDAVVTHGFNTVAYTQTDPPGGNTGPGAESDIYDCFVASCHVHDYSHSHLRLYPLISIPIPKLESYSHFRGIPIPIENPISTGNAIPTVISIAGSNLYCLVKRGA